MKRTKERLIIIDADSLIYAAAANAETKTQWDEDEDPTYHFNEEAAKAAIRDGVENLKSKLWADHVICAVSDWANFRKEIMPTYKAHRVKTRKPVGLKPLKAFVVEEFLTFQRAKLEADDVVGILATKAPRDRNDILYGKERVIVSGDKDLLTVPGMHYSTTLKKELTVSEEEADYFHMFQTLTGDPTDGYKGAPGVGPVRAEKVLKSVSRSEWWPAVVRTYQERGVVNYEAEALLNARVARICRASDYDYVKKEVILWVPK